ncbi:serine hydrolase [Stackebrandtia sp.]|uniref:serine hydrolase n=1 Tax=Stackebrandtia sp. TaxID=2023065 RepID=UPI003BF923CC
MLDELFAPLGAHAHAHIRDLDDGRQRGVDAAEPVVLMSVVKVFIAWEFLRQVNEGLIDPGDMVRVTARDRLGGTGTASFRYDAEIAVGDLAALMMELSDSTAADLVYQRLGSSALRDLPARFGLKRTWLIGSPRAILENLARDLGVSDLDDLARLLASKSVQTQELRSTSAWDPLRTNASTPSDMTEFLAAVWNGPEAIRRDLRRWMGRQLTGGHLARQLPSGVVAYGRSGSLPGWRNEIGVWEWPDGRRHALAMFVRTTRGNLREVERAMGRAALRLAELVDSDLIDLRPGPGRLGGLGDGGAPHQGPHPAIAPQQFRRLVHQDVARGGQRHLPATAVEQLGAELLLHAANPLAQRRLLHAQAPGRPAEVTFFTHREETLQVPHDVHSATISIAIPPDTSVDIGQSAGRAA